MDQLIAVEDLAIEGGTEQTPVAAKVVSLPSEPYQSERLEVVGNSSALVAAARTGEEEEEEEKVAESEG